MAALVPVARNATWPNYYPSRVAGAGIVSCSFQVTSDGAGIFHTADIKGDGDMIAAMTPIFGGVWFVDFKWKIVRFLFIDPQLVHPEPYTSISSDRVLCGAVFPHGNDDDSPFARASFGYVSGDVVAPTPPNTTVMFRFDLQTEEWGSR